MDDTLPKEIVVLVNYPYYSHCCMNGGTSHGLYDHAGLMSAPDVGRRGRYVSLWEQVAVEHCAASGQLHSASCRPALSHQVCRELVWQGEDQTLIPVDNVNMYNKHICL